MKKWIFAVIGVAVVGVLIVLFLPKKGEVIEVPPPLVEVEEIKEGTVTRSVDLVGYVAPQRQTAAMSRAFGKVTDIRIREGQRVYADQVLMILQPEEVGLEFKPQPVKAPISGVVADVMVKEGEPVTQGTPVAAIIDQRNIEVEMAVAGEYYNDVKIRNRAIIYVNSDTIEAKITAKTPVVDPVTRTFNISLRPLGSSAHLVSGLSVTVRLILEEKEGVLTASNSAIEDSRLKVVAGDTVEIRNVKLGTRGVEKTEIKEGASPGEVIIVFGGQNLGTGQQVRTATR